MFIGKITKRNPKVWNRIKCPFICHQRLSNHLYGTVLVWYVWHFDPLNYSLHLLSQFGKHRSIKFVKEVHHVSNEFALYFRLSEIWRGTWRAHALVGNHLAPEYRNQRYCNSRSPPYKAPLRHVLLSLLDHSRLTPQTKPVRYHRTNIFGLALFF